MTNVPLQTFTDAVSRYADALGEYEEEINGLQSSVCNFSLNAEGNTMRPCFGPLSMNATWSDERLRGSPRLPIQAIAVGLKPIFIVWQSSQAAVMMTASSSFVDPTTLVTHVHLRN